MLKLIKKKLGRLSNINNTFKLRKFFFKMFGEKDPGELKFDFSKKKPRVDIVQNIIRLKQYKSYLEIGTEKDYLFSKIECDYKVGVDPISGGTNRETSDSFFNKNKETFDCVFIDGLHHYEQVKKDIKNSLKILNKDGIILIHDCLPNNIYAQTVPRCTIDWNGDVWKALVECRVMEDLDCYTCYADFGIGVIFKRNNKKILNLKIKDFSKLTFKDYFINHKEFMNIIEYEDMIKLLN